MCGFAGFVDGAGMAEGRRESIIREMALSIERRGPDDEGFWSHDETGLHLGFRRLAILDLSELGHQPMISSTGRFVLTFNGEIYNFQSLRSELEREGHTFRSGSDTEVILAAFESWGVPDSIVRFQGMFAFAVFDTRDRELWLARDRVGIKPLFIAERGSTLVFGSELRALMEHPSIERTGDREAAWHFLRSLYVPAPLSMIEGVKKVMPGTLLRYAVDASGARKESERRYWDLPEIAGTEPDRTDPEEALDSLRALLQESVRLRLIADVPVGTLLSGGIDSSLIAALMAEQADQAIRTFTVRFDDERFDEGPIAAEISSHLGARHTEIDLPTSAVRDLVPELPTISDEPMANPSFLPTLLVCQAARRDVVVALSGDGGDELFGGYNRYLRAPNLIETAGRVPRPMRSLVEAGIGGISKAPGIEAVGRRLLPSGFAAQHTFSSRLNRIAAIAGAADARRAYEEFTAVGHRVPPILPLTDGGEEVDRRCFDRHPGSLLSRIMLLDQAEYLPDDLLAKVDRASMWTSLEARVPILDHPVVEFSWTLSDDLKIRDGVSKYLLRQIVYEYLPRELIDRPKMGFTVPLDGWLRSDLSSWLADTLHPDQLRQRDLFDVPAVVERHELFRGGNNDVATGLWAVTMLEAWSANRGVTFGG